jgi:DeoR/GlpR family transcriptional regulator of sugar metabolism
MTSDRGSGGSGSLRYRDASARRTALAELVQQQGFCRVPELSDLLGVSRITVRRDIALLERDNLVRGAYGGVMALAQAGPGAHFRLRSAAHTEAKQAIGRKAIEYLSGHAIGPLGIDAGTTAFQAARFIAPHTPLTVVTHSLPVMTELAQRSLVEVVGIGGVLHPETQAFAGPSTVAGYAGLRLGTVLLTASAVRDQMMLCGNAFDAETKRQMMAVADQIILLVDASKFDAIAPFQTAELSRVDVVVIDDQAPPALVKSLEAQHLRVLVAEIGADTTTAERRGDKKVQISQPSLASV